MGHPIVTLKVRIRVHAAKTGPRDSRPALVLPVDRNPHRKIRLQVGIQAKCTSTRYRHSKVSLPRNDSRTTLASLWVTFGGKLSPFLFSDLSEQVADLANVLTRCKLWDLAELRPKHSQ